jgi:hypothetical protein
LNFGAGFQDHSLLFRACPIIHKVNTRRAGGCFS